MQTTKYPRFMLAAAGSGSGKTYVTCGLLSLFSKKGIHVRAFKCGPDYIDPMFHKEVLQIPSKNLDPFFTKKEKTRELFAMDASSELSIVEGVMGYYDGLGGISLEGSSYDLACQLDLPVILVIDAKGCSRSLCALVKGLVDYEPEKHIRGVLFNRMSGMMYPKIKEQIEAELPIACLGYIPENKDFSLESRHLGLKLPEEVAELRDNFRKVAAQLEKSVDIEKLLEIARDASEMDPVGAEADREGASQDLTTEIPIPKCSIGVALDSAFCFYYQDNLRLLEDFGAKLVYFSPLKDAHLPQVDGLLLGGGYPELHAELLSENHTMKQDLKKAAEAGMPIYAECGGFLYLQQYMSDLNGQKWEMAGVLSGESNYTGKLGRFGYIMLEIPKIDNVQNRENWQNCENEQNHENAQNRDDAQCMENTQSSEIAQNCENEVKQENWQIKGHEFHYFDSTENGSLALAKKPTGNRQWDCMVREKGVLAGFPHLYYPSCPQFAQDFVKACISYQNKKQPNE